MAGNKFEIIHEIFFLWCLPDPTFATIAIMRRYYQQLLLLCGELSTGCHHRSSQCDMTVSSRTGSDSWLKMR